MKVVVQDTIRNRQWTAYEGRAGFSIGRGEGCTVRLQDHQVSRLLAVIERVDGEWELSVPGSASGTIVVGSKSVSAGETCRLEEIVHVRVSRYIITVDQESRKHEVSEVDEAIEDIDTLQRELHTELLNRLDLRRTDNDDMEASPENLERINTFIDELLEGAFRARAIESKKTRDRLLGMDYENRVVRAMAAATGQLADEVAVEAPGRNLAFEDQADEFVRRLIKRLKLVGTKAEAADDLERINEGLTDLLPGLIGETPDNVKNYLVSRFLKKIICDLVFGLGPLQDLLDTPAISEIMIVDPTRVYVERGGRILRSNRTFLGDKQLLNVIDRIVSPLGRRVDRETPLADARLKDGSRVNAVIPPLALKGPTLTIRRFPSHRITPEDLIEWGTLTDPSVMLLDGAVVARKNIIVAGGTGSGKTTLLNVLSGFIPSDERIVTIEDAAELQLAQDHVVSLETRPKNVEGKGEYSIGDLVRNALRMRPDRIVVGECRGGETLDMLQAMNTGHDGSLTTVHANGPTDVVARLETMVLSATAMPIEAIRRQIAQAVDLIVFVRRMKNGSRLVTHVTEVRGIHKHDGDVEMNDILVADTESTDPELRLTGYMPTFLGEFVDKEFIDLGRWFNAKGVA